MSSRKPRCRIGRIFWLLAAVAMIVAVMPLAGAAAETEDPLLTVELIAGGGNSDGAIHIGEVKVWDDGVNLYVKYVVDLAPWCLTSTAVDIQTDSDPFPVTKKKGLPKIGHFEFKADHDCVTEHMETIALGDMSGLIEIAAHADTMKISGLEGVEMVLPDTANMTYVHTGGDSYFNITLSNGLTGTYDGWCVDTDNYVTNGLVKVSSSYADDADYGNIKEPENLPYVNWLINNYAAGDMSVAGGAFTMCDIQHAIWDLVGDDDYPCTPSDDDRVAELFDAAWANGADFEPGCGEYVAIILVSIDDAAQSTIYQTTFAELGIECDDQEETAWAGVWTENDNGSFADRFADSSWAGYFEYEIVPVLP